MADVLAERFRFADVTLRGAEVAVPGALHDPDVLRAVQDLPGDARGAQVVEGHALGGGAVCEQVSPLHAGALQVRAQRRRQVLGRRHPVLGLLVVVGVLDDPPFAVVERAGELGADGGELRALRVLARAHCGERGVERAGERYQVADGIERERAIVGHVPKWWPLRLRVNAPRDFACRRRRAAWPRDASPWQRR
ncbi:MAG TPA: hypothetical protein VIW29_01615, partial [Polyangiaceae bacterium]